MNGKPWTDSEIWRFIAFYPDMNARALARKFGRNVTSINGMSGVLGIHKSPEYRERLNRSLGRRLQTFGRAHRFPKGHVPANKGLRRPGFARGRMRETQFKKGQFPFIHDPEFYALGALRRKINRRIRDEEQDRRPA